MTNSRIALLATAVAVAAGVWGAFWYLDVREEANAAARRVLVLPFENATGDTSLAALGRIAADSVASAIGGGGGAGTGRAEPIGAVAVGPEVSREDGSRESNLKRVVAEHAAGVVVDGAYRLDGDFVRLEARVIDAAGWKLLSAVAATAPRSSPQALIPALSRGVASALSSRHGSVNPAR